MLSTRGGGRGPVVMAAVMEEGGGSSCDGRVITGQFAKIEPPVSNA